MSFQEFLSKGWLDHADDAAGVMERLPQGLELATEETHLAPLAGLIAHVAGEHLGAWTEGDALLARLLAKELGPAESPASRAVWRARAILARCQGDAAREAEFTARALADVASDKAASDRIRILATAASALLHHGRIPEAARDLKEALALAAYGPTKEDPAASALAMTGNNMSCELEGRKERSPEETALMLQAASAGRRYWEIAGNWTNVERAEYRLSAAHLAAGDVAAALEHAEACLSICRANDAPPFETFFAQERIALARHARSDGPGAAAARGAAAAAMEAIEDAGDREYCGGELAKLDAALG